MKIVLFDIDGTLLLSRGAGLRALREVFRERYGVDGDGSEVPLHGRTDRAILRDLFQHYAGRDPEPAEIEEATAAYARGLEAALDGSNDVDVLPGVLDALRSLHERDDVVLGIGTGNFERTAQIKLRAAELHSYFRFGGYAEDAGPAGERTPVLRAGAGRGRELVGSRSSSVVVIGDTVLDVQASLEAGFSILAVATGPASVGQLDAAGAHRVLPTLEPTDELHAFLDSLAPSSAVPSPGEELS